MSNSIVAPHSESGICCLKVSRLSDAQCMAQVLVFAASSHRCTEHGKEGKDADMPLQQTSRTQEQVVGHGGVYGWQAVGTSAQKNHPIRIES